MVLRRILEIVSMMSKILRCSMLRRILGAHKAEKDS